MFVKGLQARLGTVFLCNFSHSEPVYISYDEFIQAMERQDCDATINIAGISLEFLRPGAKNFSDEKQQVRMLVKLAGRFAIYPFFQ
jgi:hypothetical protein